MQVERRYSKAEVRAEGHKIRGLASVNYNPDDPGSQFPLWEGAVERVMPGAFDNHLASNPDVVALFNHDVNYPLGRTGNKTLKLRADEEGLHYEIEPNDTTYTQDLLKAIQRGDVSGSSFAFLPTKVRWARDGDLEVRELHEVRLFDVSPVTVAAYSSASVGLRSSEVQTAKAERDEWRNGIETERIMNRYEQILKELDS